MLFFLQASVSLIFFANKVLILVGRKSGWLVGAIAALFAIVYFFLIELYIYTTLEAGLFVLMGYGFFKKQQRNPAVENAIRLVSSVVMILLTVFAFSGMMTIVEFVSSVLMLIGTYLLTHNKMRLGWLLYGAAHGLASIVGYDKEQQLFADFQVASAIVCFIGWSIEKKEGPHG